MEIRIQDIDNEEDSEKIQYFLKNLGFKLTGEIGLVGHLYVKKYE